MNNVRGCDYHLIPPYFRPVLCFRRRAFSVPSLVFAVPVYAFPALRSFLCASFSFFLVEHCLIVPVLATPMLLLYHLLIHLSVLSFSPLVMLREVEGLPHSAYRRRIICRPVLNYYIHVHSRRNTSFHLHQLGPLLISSFSICSASFRFLIELC